VTVAQIQAKLADTTSVFPGMLVCALIAMSATFLSDHYGGPQLLYALLIGLSLHFLTEQSKLKPGIDFCSRTLLRLGVALLGMRITVSQVVELGLGTALVAALALGATILFGLLLARLLRVSPAQGVLSGGAVAVCGASAAMAISSVLPATKENERFTLLTVVGVTLLSTVALVLYPFVLSLLPLSPRAAGVVLGGTIHDVAQVVAAGMLIGPEAGNAATVVKLFRVMLLMPVVLLVAMAFRKHARAAGPKGMKSTVPLVPGFLVAFVVLMLLTSADAFPPSTISMAEEGSRALLVAAIGAAGIKTTFADLLELGWRPVLMLASETVFIAVFVTLSVVLLGLT
jgi:uncharacterized integral membrane protein (TIGR00698 family)